MLCTHSMASLGLLQLSRYTVAKTGYQQPEQEDKRMLAIIGGTGMDTWSEFRPGRQLSVQTPYAPEPVILSCGHVEDSQELVFLPRHGTGHTVPPHRINYRANIYALREAGVKAVLAVNAVGGVHREMGPGAIAVPNQIIDYTWGREHTFFDGVFNGFDSPDRFSAAVTHIDFTEPYDEAMRQLLISSAANCGLRICTLGVYAATQGPRLETPAEVKRIERDGGDMIGMTGMPEAALAREAGLAYATLALSVNYAAGLGAGSITVEAIREVLASGMGQVQQILAEACKSYGKS